jgi:N-acetylneuraminic acid mutarotase
MCAYAFGQVFLTKTLFNSLKEYIIDTNMKKMSKIVILLLVLYLVLLTLSLPLVNAIEDSWETLESMPTARSGLGVAVVNGKIYAIGGSNGSALNVNEMYDPVTNTWTTKTSMPTARSNFGIAVVQNKIHVIGGYVRYSGISDAHEVYDVETDTWETRNSSSSYGAYFSANVVDDKIFLMGGSLSPFNPWPTSDENRVYCPLTDTWTVKEPLPTAVSHYASTVINNEIYVIGGRDIESNATYNFNQNYDTETNTWNYKTPIPASIYGATACATSGFFAPKRIYVMGGYISPRNFLNNQTYVYNPETDTWTTCTPMPTLRYHLAVAVVEDRLYAIGGHNRHNYVTVNEMYTPAGYIPEFPSWIVLPLFIVATLAVIVYRKKLHAVT